MRQVLEGMMERFPLENLQQGPGMYRVTMDSNRAESNSGIQSTSGYYFGHIPGCHASAGLNPPALVKRSFCCLLTAGVTEQKDCQVTR